MDSDPEEWYYSCKENDKFTLAKKNLLVMTMQKVKFDLVPESILDPQNYSSPSCLF